jgi:low temperature requirement protein LtrA
VSRRGAELLRDHQDPQRAGYVELFVDLVYVFAFVQVSLTLVEDLTWRGAFRMLVTLMALWWVWSFTAWMTNRFDPERPAIQLVAIPIMLGTLLMSVAVPDAFGGSGLLFAASYVAIQVGLSLFVVLAVRVEPEHTSAVRALVWFLTMAVPWLTGAFVAGPIREVFWGLAVALTFLVLAIDFAVPKLGKARTTDWSNTGEHLSERYRQFVIIVFGHTILATGLVTRSNHLAEQRIAGLVVAFATTVMLWRIYYYHAGEKLEAAIGTARLPGRVGRQASQVHLVMVTGILVTSVGEEIMVEHPFGQTERAWTVAIVTGPALFLAGRGWLDYLAFSRIAWSRLIGLVVITAIAPALESLPPIQVALAALLVLTGIAVSDTIAWRRTKRQPTPPG